MEENKIEVKPKKSLIRRIISWSLIGLFAAFVGFIGSSYIIGTIHEKENYGVRMAYGYGALKVLTDSMEDEYPKDSIIFITKIDDYSTIKVGDDLTFYYEPYRMVVTHRVIETSVNESGLYTFTLHGINTNSEQCEGDCTDQTQTVTQNEVVGKVALNSPFLGKVFNFFTSIWGLIILLLIPAGYIITITIIDMYKKLKAADEEENAANLAEKPAESSSNSSLLEGYTPEELEKLKQEMLDEMMKGKDK